MAGDAVYTGKDEVESWRYTDERGGIARLNFIMLMGPGCFGDSEIEGVGVWRAVLRDRVGVECEIWNSTWRR